MATRIRLTRMGKRDKPFFRIVVVDKASKRDGKAIAKIGYYDPSTKPPKVSIDKKAFDYWISVGATPSPTVSKLIK